MAKRKKTLLVDGDVIAYQIAFRSEEATDWGDGMWTLHADEKMALPQVDAVISGFIEKQNATDVIIALTDHPTFRDNLNQSYKLNRAGTRKPMLLPVLRKYMEDNYNTYLKPGLEADDCLGILSTHKTLVKGEKIIVSIDKDFKTIPGKFWNYQKDEMYNITEEMADYWFMMQTLTGDATDGYAGCPGVGPVKARRILDGLDPKDLWSAVVDCYKGSGLNEAEALLNARFARILRASDYDFKRKKVKLWQPPS